MVAGMLGVIRAGAAYLPVDSSHPSIRVQDTLADASPTAIVTERALAGTLASAAIPIIFLEDVFAASRQTPDGRERETTKPDDLAYVIYTSGSTGRPKGVMVTHRNVLRLLAQTEPWFHFNEQDVWTMFHSFAFDFSVWEMWGCLLSGGRLVVVPFAVSRSPEDFYRLLWAERVTVLNQTPSAFSLLIQVEERASVLPLALRVVILGGDALNLRSLRPWFARHGDDRPEIVNMYGITETTVHVTYRRILSGDAEKEADSLIGKPIPDLQIHLCDEHLQPVANGQPGEICIGGAGVALGYLNRPELTAERFIADPSGKEGARLYRSGDMALRRADGELVYLGRADRQVKINGFRIELAEVEAALSSFPGIAQVCVAPYTPADGTPRLVAYYVTPAAFASSRELGEFLAVRLPAHMRPAFYIPLDVLPLTANGKVDRAALPCPGTPVEPATVLPPVAYASAMEEKLAEIWKRVLGNERLGLEDNFFDVGGSSLLLIATRSALQTELNRSIPITWFFEHTTIRALARRLEEEPATNLPATSPAQDNARRQREMFARMRASRSATR
jgi:amino acid adenylation domain-containing protein